MIKTNISKEKVKELRSQSSKITEAKIIKLQKEFFKLVKARRNKAKVIKLRNNIITGLIAKGLEPQKASFFLDHNLKELLKDYSIKELNNLVKIK